ncbi:MAG: DUF5317 domain-containing protein [Chloroflexi bacterium]|nr:DUF5317 domain-containing protein [Chloroflexota bacterium]
MILLVALIVALLAALIRGGRISALGEVRFRAGWLAIVALAIQAVVIYLPHHTGTGPWSLGALFLAGSYVALVAVVVLNRHTPGMLLIGAGLAMNYLAMASNGGYMPIAPDALEQAGLGHLALAGEVGSRILATKDILLPREQTLLWVLSDILVIPDTLPISSVFSVGDVVVALGVCWFFQRAMAPATPQPEQATVP